MISLHMSNFVHQAYSKAVIALADVIWFLFIGAQMLSHLPIYFHYANITIGGFNWATDATEQQVFITPLIFWGIEALLVLRHILKQFKKCCDTDVFALWFLSLAFIASTLPMSFRLINLMPYVGMSWLKLSIPCMVMTVIVTGWYLPHYIRSTRERQRIRGNKRRVHLQTK